jgi:hypothetical protein
MQMDINDDFDLADNENISNDSVYRPGPAIIT